MPQWIRYHPPFFASVRIKSGVLIIHRELGIERRKRISFCENPIKTWIFCDEECNTIVIHTDKESQKEGGENDRFAAMWRRP